MTLARKLRVVLADDNPSMLEMVSELLAVDFEVTGKFVDGDSLLKQYENLQPDLVILDVAMPQMSGFEVAKRLARLECPPRIIFLSVYDTPEFIRAAFNAGASAYVFKSRLNLDLENAIVAVSSGQKFVSLQRNGAVG